MYEILTDLNILHEAYLQCKKGVEWAGRITPEEIREQYKSWRGNLIKYNAYKSVRSTDALYKSLFWGLLWQKRKRN